MQVTTQGDIPDQLRIVHQISQEPEGQTQQPLVFLD